VCVGVLVKTSAVERIYSMSTAPKYGIDVECVDETPEKIVKEGHLVENQTAERFGERNQ